MQKTYTGTQPTCYDTSPVTYVYDGLARYDTFGGSGLPDGWMQGGSVSVNGGVVAITGDGTWASRIYKAAEDQFDGAAVQFDFRISGGGTQQGEFFYKHGEFGTSGYRRWGLQFVNGWLKLSEYVGTVNTGGQVLMAYSANTWYEGLIVADGRTGFRLVVWEQANPAKWAVYQAQPEDWEGRSWQFVAVMKNGTVQMDNYREFEAGALGQRSAMDKMQCILLRWQRGDRVAL